MILGVGRVVARESPAKALDVGSLCPALAHWYSDPYKFQNLNMQTSRELLAGRRSCAHRNWNGASGGEVSIAIWWL
jgi:hypothetical protein